MAKTPSQMTVEELDGEITELGDQIAALRKKQEPLLKAKDKLVLKETQSIRAAGSAQTLGDDRG